MKTKLLSIILSLFLSSIGLAQNQRLKISGEVSTDTLKTKAIQIIAGNNNQLLLANGNNANVGTGLSLGSDSLNATSIFVEKVSLYEFSGTASTSSNFGISPTVKLNQLNLTLTGNQLTGNWEVGKIYEITLSVRANANANNTSRSWYEFSIFSATSGGQYVWSASGVSTSIVKWVGNGISSWDYLSNSSKDYYYPNSASDILFLTGTSLDSIPLSFKGTLSIRKLN